MPFNQDAHVLNSSAAEMSRGTLCFACGLVCVCVRVCVGFHLCVKLILSIVSVLYNSGRVAKEVMEQSAKIKREPPEIHR